MRLKFPDKEAFRAGEPGDFGVVGGEYTDSVPDDLKPSDGKATNIRTINSDNTLPIQVEASAATTNDTQGIVGMMTKTNIGTIGVKSLSDDSNATATEGRKQDIVGVANTQEGQQIETKASNKLGGHSAEDVNDEISSEPVEPLRDLAARVKSVSGSVGSLTPKLEAEKAAARNLAVIDACIDDTRREIAQVRRAVEAADMSSGSINSPGASSSAPRPVSKHTAAVTETTATPVASLTSKTKRTVDGRTEKLNSHNEGNQEPVDMQMGSAERVS